MLVPNEQRYRVPSPDRPVLLTSDLQEEIYRVKALVGLLVHSFITMLLGDVARNMNLLKGIAVDPAVTTLHINENGLPTSS